MPNLKERKEGRRYTLDRSFRIRESREYRRVYSRGKRFSNRVALMYVAKAKNRPVRIGFVATKHIGNAVARNRSKRLMKEVYRLHRHELASGYELIMLAGSFLTGASFSEAEKAILTLWRKAGLMERTK